LEKCEFHQPEVEFLGYVIFRNGIHMDHHNVHTIVDWAAPTSIRNVQCFLEFTNFYRHFITQYSSIVTPFTQLIRKDQPISWGIEVSNVFQSLKTSFTTTHS
jgi:hypothetical protein